MVAVIEQRNKGCNHGNHSKNTTEATEIIQITLVKNGSKLGNGVTN
jgi:hypothetical protein